MAVIVTCRFSGDLKKQGFQVNVIIFVLDLQGEFELSRKFSGKFSKNHTLP